MRRLLAFVLAAVAFCAAPAFAGPLGLHTPSGPVWVADTTPNSTLETINGQTYNVQRCDVHCSNETYSGGSYPACLPGGCSAFQQGNGTQQSYSIERDNRGTLPHFRFECRAGDEWVDDNGRNPKRARAEFSNQFKMTVGTTYWYAFQLRTSGLAGSSVGSSQLIVGQGHATDDGNSSVTSHPLWSIDMSVSSFVRHMSSYAPENPLVSPQDINQKRERVSTVAPGWVNGRVYNYVMKMVPDAGTGSGVWQVWRDGILIVDYAGAFGYNMSVGPYVKMGCYRVDENVAIGTGAVVVEYFNVVGPTTVDQSSRVTSPPALP